MMRSNCTRSAFILGGLFCAATVQSQSLVSSEISMRVTQVAVLNTADCDALAGDSDFGWHFIATDNTLGYSNNDPTDNDFLGAFNFCHRDGANGPYSMAPNDGSPDSGWDPSDGIFFAHRYCATDVPTNINIAWRGYENDATGDYSTTNSPDGNTGAQNKVFAVPASGTMTQTYTASGSSGSCPQNYSITFELTRTNVMSAPPVDMTICQGDSAEWQGNFYHTAGTHRDTLTSVDGCDSIVSLQLAINPTINAGVSIATNTGTTACVGEVVIFTATPSAAGANPSYQWYLNGQNIGVINNSFGTTALNSGDVVLCVMTVDTFCVADSTVASNVLAMTIETCTGVSAVEEASGWNVYPNPAQDQLWITSVEQPQAVSIRLFTVTGQAVRDVTPAGFPYTLAVDELPRGLYLLHLASPKGVITHKIILE